MEDEIETIVEPACVVTFAGRGKRRIEALQVPDEHPIDLDREVELSLGALQLQVAHEDPRQRPAQEQADADYAGGRRQYAESEAQMRASSSRYPTPHTVSMLGSVTPAAANFSRSCWTWTSTVRVYPGKS